MDNSIHPRAHGGGNRIKSNTSKQKTAANTKAHAAHCERHPKDAASRAHLHKRP